MGTYILVIGIVIGTWIAFRELRQNSEEVNRDYDLKEWRKGRLRRLIGWQKQEATRQETNHLDTIPSETKKVMEQLLNDVQK